MLFSLFHLWFTIHINARVLVLLPFGVTSAFTSCGISGLLKNDAFNALYSLPVFDHLLLTSPSRLPLLLINLNKYLNVENSTIFVSCLVFSSDVYNR